MSANLNDCTATEAKVLAQAKAIMEKRVTRGIRVTGFHDVDDLFVLELNSLEQEQFGCLFLDTRHRIIAFEILFSGTINRSNVHPRVVAKRALDLNAAAVIFGHNHPSGDPSPSQSDIDITLQLKEVLEIFDLVVLDHLVVGGGQIYSFAAHGLC